MVLIRHPRVSNVHQVLIFPPLCLLVVLVLFSSKHNLFPFPGTYNPNSGATSSSSCVACLSGSSSLSSASSCVQCSAGTYAPNAGSFVCCRPLSRYVSHLFLYCFNNQHHTPQPKDPPHVCRVLLGLMLLPMVYQRAHLVLEAITLVALGHPFAHYAVVLASILL